MKTPHWFIVRPIYAALIQTQLSVIQSRGNVSFKHVFNTRCDTMENIWTYWCQIQFTLILHILSHTHTHTHWHEGLPMTVFFSCNTVIFKAMCPLREMLSWSRAERVTDITIIKAGITTSVTTISHSLCWLPPFSLLTLIDMYCVQDL